MVFFCLRHCREGGGQEPVTEALWDETNRHCDEGTVVHQEYRCSESVLNEETQSRDLPLCLHLYLILAKSWTFSGPWIPPKQLTTSSN